MNIDTLIKDALIEKYIHANDEVNEYSDNYSGCKILNAYVRVCPEDFDNAELVLELDNASTLCVGLDTELQLSKNRKAAKPQQATPVVQQEVLYVEPDFGNVIGITSGTFDDIICKFQSYLSQHCKHVGDKYVLDASLAKALGQEKLPLCDVRATADRLCLEFSRW